MTVNLRLARTVVPVVLACGLSGPAAGQSPDPPPSRLATVADADDTTAPDWDTSRLIEDVEGLTPDELPRLQARAEGGDAWSQVLLGLAHEFGSAGLSRRPSEGLPWFLKAAAQGIPWAEAWAADFYMNGATGVDRDLARAHALYVSAGTRGDARAAFMVGQMYFHGDGVDESMPDAAVWFDRSARAGSPLGPPMAELAALSCAAEFCTTLRQVLGGLLSSSAGRLVDSWNPAADEWSASVTLPGSERCGFTSTDRTAAGEPLNFFCDSAPIADPTRGMAVANEVADQIARALPAGYARIDRADPHPGPSIYFRREGYPNVRVAYNVTPGLAQHRVTVLIGS